MKVRWMREPDGLDAHAFPILTGGTLREYAVCGLPLVSMHLWTADRSHPSACRACKAGSGKGARA